MTIQKTSSVISYLRLFKFVILMFYSQVILRKTSYISTAPTFYLSS